MSEKMNENGCSTCQAGFENYETYESRVGRRIVKMVQYDFRTEDGELFSCCGRTLEECRERRDKWLETRVADVMVCEHCGSTNVQIKAWVDANTEVLCSEIEDGIDGQWCEDCECHRYFDSKSNYEDKMQRWFANLEFDAVELMSGLRQMDFNQENGAQEFVDAVSKWWAELPYDDKRDMYNTYNEEEE